MNKANIGDIVYKRCSPARCGKVVDMRKVNIRGLDICEIRVKLITKGNPTTDFEPVWGWRSLKSLQLDHALKAEKYAAQIKQIEKL
jgi:hypothetical protein